MKVGFFEEKQDVKSMMRLMSFMLLIFLFVSDILLFYLIGDSETFTISDLFSKEFLIYHFIMLGFVFTPKVMQKLAESKIDKI